MKPIYGLKAYLEEQKRYMKKLLFFAIVILFAAMSNAQKKPVILNHVAIDVTDLSKSTSFYSGIIQIDSMPNPFNDGRHTWYKVGEHAQLHLIEVKNEITVHYKGTHICFTVPSIETIISRLDKYHIHYEDWKGKSNSYTMRPDGVKQIYFQDPDGYWIEINNDKF